MAGDQVFQPLAHAAASGHCGAAVDNHAQRVDRVAVDEDAHLHKVALAVADLVVIERRPERVEGPRDMLFRRS